jgi:chemotaxis protein methyltransferase CheR
MTELGLEHARDYRVFLERTPSEWSVLDSLVGVTISRFQRDRGVWDALREEVLPELAARALAEGEPELACWSVGCASGEEPYTASLLWSLELANLHPNLRLRILATDVDADVLERARRAEYASGTLRELPEAWRAAGFERTKGGFRLRPRFREAVELRCLDVRAEPPAGSFHLVLCRNLVCTYFAEPMARRTIENLCAQLEPGGAFVIGQHETLPFGAPLGPWSPRHGIFRKRAPARAD